MSLKGKEKQKKSCLLENNPLFGSGKIKEEHVQSDTMPSTCERRTKFEIASQSISSGTKSSADYRDGHHVRNPTKQD